MLFALRAQAARAAAVCSAESFRENAGKAAASFALAAVVTMAAPSEVFAKEVAPYAGLTPCKGNAAFAKREKNELKVLDKRLKQVNSSTIPGLQNGAGLDPPIPSMLNCGG